MKDLIIGCITNYTPENIKPWVQSIKNSGFNGDKIVISFGLPDETLYYLNDNGFGIYKYDLNGNHIVVERFFAMWHLLSSLEGEYDHLITTDVKDVVFQTNPSEWLKNNLFDKKILVSSECIRYKDEDWGNNNLKTSFPHLYDMNKDNIIYNAGTIAGKKDYMKDFFLHIYHLSLIGNDKQPDQAALNILINTNPYKEIVKFASQEDGWCCQLGTTLDPKVQKKYFPLLTEPVPTYTEDYNLLNSKKERFCLVHQYDRVPILEKEISIKHGGYS